MKVRATKGIAQLKTVESGNIIHLGRVLAGAFGVENSSVGVEGWS